jgi:hypothetical protein
MCLIRNQVCEQSYRGFESHLLRHLPLKASKTDNAKVLEIYMRQANKAQANCRHTIETLNALMNPSPRTLKQNNIAHGHQQLNNGVSENAENRTT